MNKVSLVLDLSKSGTLNTSKLVKKPILVRGKDGKVFTRMQWVEPGQAPGADKQKKKDNKNNEPKKTVKISTPQAKILNDNFYKQIHEVYKREGDTSVTKDLESPTPVINSNVYSEDPFVESIIRTVIKPSEKVDYDSDTSLVMRDPNSLMKELGRKLGFSDFKSMVDRTIENSPSKDKFVKNVQKGALKEGTTFHDMRIAAHPDLAKQAVNKILGEDIANSLREDMKDANLTINFSNEHKDHILENGYVASTAESYIRKTMGEEQVEVLNEIINGDYDNEQERIADMPYLGEWSEVGMRADAEFKAIGLHLEDSKPVYIAFNPIGNPSGGASTYGARVLEVDPSVLSSCTASLDDTFSEERSFATVASIDHLKDMFILKSIESHSRRKGGGSSSILKVLKDENSPPWYAKASRDIPIELQYHKPKLDTDLFTLMKNPMYDDQSDEELADLLSEDLDISDEELEHINSSIELDSSLPDLEFDDDDEDTGK